MFNSSERNQTHSPFLRLPAELRIHIYEHVFAGRTYHFEHWDGPRLQDRNGTSKQHISVLKVCRQFRADTHLLPYALGIFSFRSLIAMTDFFAMCTHAQLSAIRRLQIHTLRRDVLLPTLDILTTEDFCLMGKMEKLEWLHIILDHGKPFNQTETDYEEDEERIKRLAKMLRQWKPNLKITATRTSSKWL
jgi:hypothetical protein